MKLLRLFVATIPAAANWIAVATMALWLMKVLYLDTLPEVFPSAHSLGEIAVEIYSAIIAGYIGFIAFVQYPAFREQRAIAPQLRTRLQRIVGDCLVILREVNGITGGKLRFADLDPTAAKAAFAAVSPATPPNMIDSTGRNVTWLFYFKNRRDRTYREIERVERQTRFFGSELINLLSALETNVFFMMCETLGNAPVNLPNLQIFAEPFCKYAACCRDLAAFHDRHFSPPAAAILAEV